METKLETYCILTQEGNLPFNVVKTEEEAKEIINTIRRSNSTDYIKVVNFEEYQKLFSQLNSMSLAIEEAVKKITHHMIAAGGSNYGSLNSAIRTLKGVQGAYTVNRTLPG